MALGAPHAYSEEAAEARNPALHNSAHYYQGSVEQAIADARAKNSFLVIFLKGEVRQHTLLAYTDSALSVEDIQQLTAAVGPEREKP